MADLPSALRTSGAGRPTWAAWLTRAPRLLDDLIGDWRLGVDGPPRAGSCAVVVPVRAEDGRAGVLKLSWPHWEAETEHLALRAWQGDGAVQLWRADPRRFALLLERADLDRDLNQEPVLDACEVVAGLYRRLHRAPLPQTRRLSELCREWAERLTLLSRTNLVPRRFVGQAERLLRDFADDPATDRALIHTDLHYANVLAADREPWLAIDPKPLAGDPAYEVAPLLWNRWDEVLAAASPRQALLARLYAVVDAAGLDEDRVRDWVVVREVCNVLWAHEDQLHAGTPVRPDAVTTATTILKAVQR
ncbi:aminoglycoside phosphotransferase family protein [Microlunatus ginsengisoli]|uniref:Streptomycin 6-kinase n=1 Tax=Microlunatus ginsengisoli TaxID=363863 RepID=A0ABP6ZN33_9ACTN